LYDPNPILRSDLKLEQWDYVALGHYHIHHKIADNAYYAGSTEFTSFNIWEEVGTPKGFIEYDINDHEMIGFHQVETREVVSLRPLDASEYTAEEMSKSVQEFIENIDGGHKDKIIRLVIENIPRSVQADLDYAMIRRLKSEALHLELQFRPPAARAGDTHAYDGPAKPLEEEWQDFAAAYGTPAGVERRELAELGQSYLAGQASQEAPD
jgi:DNA repair exonuclease SbcCD nuclease subunit